MLSRRQEFSLQLNQIVDGLVLALALYAGYALRRYQVIDFDAFPPPPFEGYLWLLLVTVLFGPLLLEIQGFYQHPLEKSARRSLQQIVRAGAWLGLILGGCVVFLKLTIPSRSAFLLFMVLAPLGLLAREAVYRRYRLGRLRHGGPGESILMAGTPQRMTELVEGLSPVQRLEINIAADRPRGQRYNQTRRGHAPP